MTSEIEFLFQISSLTLFRLPPSLHGIARQLQHSSKMRGGQTWDGSTKKSLVGKVHGKGKIVAAGPDEADKS